MDQWQLLRDRHGRDAYVTNFPDGLTIPWHPLSIEEFQYYDQARHTGRHVLAYLEDEIFKLCVLSPVYTDNISKLKAGVISTVVQNIMSYSGPEDISDLNNLLQASRESMQQIIHQMVSLVCQAFPAYTPEDVYKLEYSVLIQRVALAEDKLMKVGLIQEPISFSTGEEEEAPAAKPPAKIDAFKLFEEVYERPGQASTQPAPRKKRSPAPPITKSKNKVVIDESDILEHQAASVGHEQDVVELHNSVQDTARFYDDYLKQIEKGEPVRILNVEERKAAAEARSEEHRKQNLKVAQDQAVKDKKEMVKLLEIREQARKRKEKKLRKNRRR